MTIAKINAKEFDYLKSSSLGQRIRFIRKKLAEANYAEKYSTTNLAKKLGVTPQALTSIERDVSKNPSFFLICNLAKIFNVPIEVFTDDFYEGNTRIFQMGDPKFVIDLGDFPDFEDLDIDDIEIVAVDSANNFSSKSNEQIDFNSDDEDSIEYEKLGVLVYKNDLDSILLHKQLHSSFFDNSELIEFLSRIIFNLELFSHSTNSYFDDLESISKLKPIEEAYNIVNNKRKNDLNK